jgi:hypothetical protein
MSSPGFWRREIPVTPAKKQFNRLKNFAAAKNRRAHRPTEALIDIVMEDHPQYSKVRENGMQSSSASASQMSGSRCRSTTSTGASAGDAPESAAIVTFLRLARLTGNRRPALARRALCFKF